MGLVLIRLSWTKFNSALCSTELLAKAPGTRAANIQCVPVLCFTGNPGAAPQTAIPIFHWVSPLCPPWHYQLMARPSWTLQCSMETFPRAAAQPKPPPPFHCTGEQLFHTNSTSQFLNLYQFHIPAPDFTPTPHPSSSIYTNSTSHLLILYQLHIPVPDFTPTQNPSS